MNTHLEKMSFKTKSGKELSCYVYAHRNGSKYETYVGLHSLKKAFIKYMSDFGKIPYRLDNEGIRMFDYEKEMFYMVEIRAKRIRGKRHKYYLTPFNERFRDFLDNAMDLKANVLFNKKKSIERFDDGDIWLHYSLYGIDVFVLKILSGVLEIYKDRVILCNNKEMLKKMYDEVYWESIEL